MKATASFITLSIILSFYTATVQSFPKQRLIVKKRFNCFAIPPSSEAKCKSLRSNYPSISDAIMAMNSDLSVDRKKSFNLRTIVICALSVVASILLPLGFSDMNLKVQTARAADSGYSFELLICRIFA